MTVLFLVALFLILTFSFSGERTFGSFLADAGYLFREAFWPVSSDRLAEEVFLGSERKPINLAALSAGESGSFSNKKHPQILISELAISPREERFVKIYNPNDFDVDLTGWYVQRRTKTGQNFSSFISSSNFEGKAIKADGYFLIAGPEGSLSEKADLLLQLTLTSGNSLRIRNPSRENSDKLGYGEAGSFLVASAPEPGEGEVLARKKLPDGKYSNTGNNAEDFEVITIFNNTNKESFGDGDDEENDKEEESDIDNGVQDKDREEINLSEVKQPSITLEYPEEIKTSEEFEVFLSVSGLSQDSYDVKISISTGESANISDIYEKSKSRWRSSFYYLQDYFSGSVLEKERFRLWIRDDHRSFEGGAEIGVRIRKNGGSDYFEKIFPVSLLVDKKSGEVAGWVAIATSGGGGGNQPAKEECSENSVEINSASQADLEKLQGVGPAIAGSIMEKRPFFVLNELKEVSGIGEVKLQSIKDQGCAYIDGNLLSPKENDEYEEEDEKVEINSAAKEKLELIIGIGPAYAERIVENRPFCSLNDLLEISGIGEKTLQDIDGQGIAYVEPSEECGSENDGKEENAGSGNSENSEKDGDMKKNNEEEKEKENEDSGNDPRITADHPPEMAFDKEGIEVVVGIEGFNSVLYDIKVSIETEDNQHFSEIYNKESDEWESAFNYRKKMEGPSRKKVFRLRIREGHKGYEGPARVVIRLRENNSVIKEEISPIEILIPKEKVSVGPETVEFKSENDTKEVEIKNLSEQSIKFVAEYYPSGDWLFIDNKEGELEPGKSVFLKISLVLEKLNKEIDSAEIKIKFPENNIEKKVILVNLNIEYEKIPENLLNNSFFEEWENGKPNNWKWDGAMSRIKKDEENPFYGDFNVALEPIGSKHNRLEQSVEGIKDTIYHGLIWAKGMEGAKIRVGIKRDGHYQYGDYVELEDENWTEVSYFRDSGTGEDDGMIISVLESKEKNRPWIAIGAAWFGTENPPEKWPNN